MACALACMAANADEVTFDFAAAGAAQTNPIYGVTGYTGDATPYLTNGDKAQNGAVTIEFNGDAASAWRMWSDGMRGYGKTSGKNPYIVVEANGATITNIALTFKSGTTYALPEGAAGTWTADGTTGGAWTGSATSVRLNYTKAANQVAIATLTVTYDGGSVSKVAAPKIACADNMVTITAEGADAIYYTTDGTDPSNASTQYTEPFAITENVTVKAIAYQGTESSSVTTFNATYVGTYDGFAAFIAANTTGIVAGPLYVLYQSADKRYLYLKDSKDAYLLAMGQLADAYENGDILASITGKYSPYAQLPEMTPTAVGTMTKGTTIAPTEYTVEELSVEMANEYIVLNNVSIVAGTGKNFTITDETGTVAGYNSLSLTEIPQGENFTLTGFVSRYNDNLQITPVAFEGGQVMQTVATPTFSVAQGAVAEGTKVALACETEGATIYYTTDNTEPTDASTEYTAEIEINAAMTIKAIAIKEGMINSAVATATYTVLDPTQSKGTYNFVDMTGFNHTLTLPTDASTGTDIAGMSFTSNAVTLAFDENTATNVARIWKLTGGDYQLRVYTSDAFTVSVPQNYKIVSIEMTSTGSSYLKLKADTGTYTVNQTVGTWTPAEATNTVKFGIETNARINTIDVVYTNTSAVDTIEADADTQAEYYNLQGVRVANPEKGLYIVKRGNTVTKQLIR